MTLNISTKCQWGLFLWIQMKKRQQRWVSLCGAITCINKYLIYGCHYALPSLDETKEFIIGSEPLCKLINQLVGACAGYTDSYCLVVDKN